MSQYHPYMPPLNFMYPYGSPYLPIYYQGDVKDYNYRTEVLKWFGNLDSSEQYQIFSIKTQIKTFPIMQMYIYDRLFVQSHYALRHQQINLQQRFDDQFVATSKTLHPKAEEFYDLLRITDDQEFLDTIFLMEGSLLDQKKFFDLIFEVSNNQFLSRPPKVSQHIEDPDWFNQKSFRSCVEWIVREFEKSIGFYFAISNDKKKKSKNYKQTTIKNNTNELQKFFFTNLSNNKERLLKFYGQIQTEMSKKPDSLENLFYNNIFQSPAIKILKSSTDIQVSFLQKCYQDQNIIQSMVTIKMSDLVEQKTYLLKKFYPIVLNLYQEYLEQELIQSEMNPKIKQKNKKKKKKKSIKIDVENQNKTQITTISNKQFEQNLISSPDTVSIIIEKPQILIEMNEISRIEQISTEVENIMETYQQSKYQQEDQFIKEAEDYLVAIINDCYEYLHEEEIYSIEQRKLQKKKKSKKIKQENNIQNNISELNNTAQTKNNQETQQSDSLLEQQKSTLQKKQSIQQEDVIIESVQSQEEHDCQALSQSTECSINSNLQKQGTCESQKIIIDSDCNLGRDKMLEFITIDIINFTDIILSEYDRMLPFRMIAFNRIKFIIQALFYLPDDKIKLFGSCATGLALLDSDIDVGISSFENLDKHSLRKPFNQLYYALNQKNWVIKSKSIFNTSVPVIKLEIDPLIFFEDFTLSYLNVDELQAQEWMLLRQNLKSGIKVDISFSFQGSHLGYESTEMVIKWMQEYPSIQQIVLLLKTIIKKIGCSESYKGGLSSFSIIIMVYSYFREKRVKSQQIGEQFLDLIQFYTNEFNPITTGIGLPSQNQFNKANEPSYFFQLKDYCLPQMPITIFSPLNNRLISGSCSLFEKIIKNFKIIIEISQQHQEFFNLYVTYGKKKQQKLQKEINNFISQILISIN